jgi:hypothetical protein
MTCDLERVFGELSRVIPASIADRDHNFLFTAETLPQPPAHMETDRLYIAKGIHDYDSCFRADALWWFATKDTYTHLALLILAVLFHPEPDKVDVRLTHPASEIKHLIVEYEYPPLDLLPSGYIARPFALNYYPDETERFPFGDHQDVSDLPCFYLTATEFRGHPDEEWLRRETVTGFGTDHAAARFAELLLNATRLDNPLVEYNLEGDGGWRGVGQLSAEVRLWFPGSDAWDPSQWPPIS